MIFTDRTITVQKGVSSLDETVVLYRGDKEVEIRFTLNEKVPFKFGSGTDSNIIEKTEAAYGQLVIRTPNGLPSIFSEVTPTNRGKIVFKIAGAMIDEITEVGNYTFQIRLLDENKESRVTIPEVVNGIEIREPIATEDVSTTNEVGVATVGYALTTAGTTEDTFDSQGNYNKTTWATGDRITAAKLNKIEAGIDGVNKKTASGGAGNVDLSNYVTKETGNANQITFSDGQTFQAKLDAGTLKGEKGDKGDIGDQGPQGPAGADGQDGLTTSVSVNGTTYTQVDGIITLPNYPTGTGSNNAGDISITDTGNYFTATDVEGALQEAGSQIKEKVNISTFNSIVDRQVTRGKTSFYSVWQDGNLLSKEINTKQYGYIYLNNGNKNNTDAYTLKLALEDIDFINIPLKFNFSSTVTFWDETDTFISGYNQGSLDDGNATELLKNIPSNAKYVRMSLWVNRINDAIIAKDTTYVKDLKTKYVDNSLHIIQDNLDANFKFKKTSIQEVELYPYGNLFEKDKLLSGKYWDTKGNLKTNATASTFTFEIDPTQQYRFNFTSHITYWDETYTFISGYIQGSLDNGDATELLKNIPSNAKYVRMLVFNKRIDDAIFSLASVYAKDLRCVYYMKDFIADGENLNNTQNKNPLYGKKAIFFGDSWCAGNTSQPGGWASWIKSNNPSMTITNCGRPGATWSQCYSTWFGNQENYNSLDDEADYIIIEAYTNGLYPLVSEITKELGTIDEFTYYNSIAEIESALGDTHARDLEKCLYSIVTRWNGKKIGLMFPYKSADMLNENNAFRKFREQVFKCCRKYNIAVFDNFDSCNIPSWTQEYIDKYFFHGDDNQEHADGVHLNTLGYSIICPRIENWLKTL